MRLRWASRAGLLPESARKVTFALQQPRYVRGLGTRSALLIASLEGRSTQLRQAGKILSWGVSNFDVDDLDEALAIAGEGRIACNQVLYHLEERAIEHRVMPWCEAHGVAVVGYSPFGHGDFPRPASPGGRMLAEVAAAHGATARQVALAFLTRRPSLMAIPKSAKPANVADNAAAGDLMLSEADLARIDAVFPLGRPRGLPMI